MIKGLLIRIMLYSGCIFAAFLMSFRVNGMDLDLRKILIYTAISLTIGSIIGMLNLAKRLGKG